MASSLRSEAGPAAGARVIARLPRLRRAEAEDRRRRQLIEATIESIADVGFNATTLVEIARRAQVSTGLVAFYFGDKNGLLEATLRHLGRQLSHGAAVRLRDAATPWERVRAIVDANLGASQFERRIATVWLAFWGQVPHSPRFARVQRIYQRRIADNLTHALLPLMPRPMAAALAETIAAIVDGVWVRATLGPAPDGRRARETALRTVETLLRAHLPPSPDPLP